MKEYIEKAAVLSYPIRKDHCDKEHANERFIFGIESVMEYVENLPAADVAAVSHGRWLTTDAYPHHLYCSVCYKTYAKNAKWVNELDLPTNYCPNCGSRMEKEDEHEAD